VQKQTEQTNLKLLANKRFSKTFPWLTIEEKPKTIPSCDFTTNWAFYKTIIMRTKNTHSWSSWHIKAFYAHTDF